LSPLEFDLLYALASRRGRLVQRAELLKEVWGYRSDIESRTVDTHIAKLRAKIDRGGSSRIITVRKKGYRLR
jgi:DNA-binding response OmpR family regulator